MIQLKAEAILFDLDGVLIDSTICVVERHWRRWADKHRLDFAAIMAVAHGRRLLPRLNRRS
jgi:sugar-phosphatase